ncbi:hypothetical protein ABT369_39540 [Dactylosporangium sp. NPDC000244]|uniref:hypothetical protein n=1 Tax=Dactylosporangium sp. NPDC000244 TaxID=3154365 RepID=UPI00332AAEF8
MATVTPDGGTSNPQPPDEPNSTRELVIRIKYFTLYTALAVAASTVIAYFNEKLGFAIGTGAAVLAAIYAAKTFGKRK